MRGCLVAGCVIGELWVVGFFDRCYGLLKENRDG